MVREKVEGIEVGLLVHFDGVEGHDGAYVKLLYPFWELRNAKDITLSVVVVDVEGHSDKFLVVLKVVFPRVQVISTSKLSYIIS